MADDGRALKMAAVLAGVGVVMVDLQRFYVRASRETTKITTLFNVSVSFTCSSRLW